MIKSTNSYNTPTYYNYFCFVVSRYNLNVMILTRGQNLFNLCKFGKFNVCLIEFIFRIGIVIKHGVIHFSILDEATTCNYNQITIKYLCLNCILHIKFDILHLFVNIFQFCRVFEIFRKIFLYYFFCIILNLQLVHLFAKNIINVKFCVIIKF